LQLLPKRLLAQQKQRVQQQPPVQQQPVPVQAQVQVQVQVQVQQSPLARRVVVERARPPLRRAMST
jgi:hypothetical protein